MNTDIARLKMIEQQVRAWDVFDPDVLDVLAEIPRERFVPAGFEALAFADTEIPIGHGQWMMIPTIEGRVLQALELGPADDVLEIGTGSGFLTACIAHLARHVTSVDIYEDFTKSAESKLADVGIDNVALNVMDATRELPDGPFDAIVVTGSMQTLDSRLVDLLSEDGRLFVVVGESPVMQARVIRRDEDQGWRSEAIFETDLKPLIHGTLPPQFAF